MPLSKDVSGGGTNSDGSKSNMYCSNCFDGGKFKQPDWTVQQMQDFVKNKMKEMGFPGFIAGIFTKSIPNLIRWKQ